MPISPLIWYAFLLAISLALQHLTRCFTRFSIFTVVFCFFLVRHGVTVPFDHWVNRTFAGIEMSEVGMERFYNSLFLMYSALLLGVILGKWIFGHGIPPSDAGTNCVPGKLQLGFDPGRMLCVVIAVLVLVAVYQIQANVSLWELLTGRLTAEQYREMREYSGINTHFSLGPLYRLASIARMGILPLLVATLFVARKRGNLWNCLFWAAFLLGIAAGLLSGQKTPAVLLVLTVVLARYLERGRLGLRQVMLPAAALIVLVAFGLMPQLYRFQYPSFTYSERLDLTLYRLTREYDRSAQLYFEIYPDVKPHTHGLSSTLIRSLIGGDPNEKEPERFIPTYYLGASYHNTWNAAYIGQAWADWGYLGVGCVSLGVGFLLQFYAAWFRHARRNALTIGTQVALLIASTRLSEAGYTACLLSYGLLSSFLVSLFLKRSKNASA